MSEGVYALIGVLVGGLLNVLVTMSTEWRSRGRERRALARLLLHRVSAVAMHLDGSATVGAGNLGPFTGREDLLQFWRTHDRHFADYLDGEDWDALVTGIDAVLQATAESATVDADPGYAQRLLAVRMNSVRKAEAVLAKLAKLEYSEPEDRDRLTAMLREEMERQGVTPPA